MDILEIMKLMPMIETFIRDVMNLINEIRGTQKEQNARLDRIASLLDGTNTIASNESAKEETHNA